MQCLIIILVIIPITLLIYIIFLYNRLISLRANRQQAFSDIDVQMKQRYDLVPNLVETVKGYATHEKTIFEDISKSRSQALGADSLEDKVTAENKFSSTLKSLFAVAESYPELKANKNFLKLQQELADIENKIAAARRFFNNSTKEFNTVLQAFPANVLNTVFKFKQGKFFELNEVAQRQSVTIDLESK